VPVVQGADREAGVRHASPDDGGRLQERAEHTLDLLATGARQEQHERLCGGWARHPYREGRVELVEEGMAHQRASDSVGREPIVFEGQRREDVVDESPHLSHPPTRPGPDLRRAVEDDRHAVPLRPPRQPPVEAGKVDEHADVGFRVEKVPLGAAGQVDEPVDVEDRPQEPHDGQLRQVGDEFDALGRHVRAAEAGELDVGSTFPDRANEQRRVMVARRLAG
jgi:hypothetical protein